jgi:hypothetical protein
MEGLGRNADGQLKIVTPDGRECGGNARAAHVRAALPVRYNGFSSAEPEIPFGKQDGPGRNDGCDALSKRVPHE